jgi:hypothetical protein
MKMGEPSDDTASRYQMNQRVAGVLTRHGIELETLSISCSARLVHLYGFLKRVTGKNLTPTEIGLIFREIEQLSQVRGVIVELENWTITNSDGGWFAVPKGSRQPRGVSPGSGEDYRIDADEKKIGDLLNEIRRKD